LQLLAPGLLGWYASVSINFQAIGSYVSKYANVVLIEQEKYIASGISARNSQVIHAGIYYPLESLKTTLCIRGNKLLYEYGKKRNVPHVKCGKWIIATSDSQLEYLHTLKRKIDTLLPPNSCSFVRNHESAITAHTVLQSNTTGIIDVHTLAHSLLADIISNDGDIAFNTTVNGVSKSRSNGWEIHTKSQGNDSYTLQADFVINAAGLYAPMIAQMINPSLYDLLDYTYCKGHYLRYTGRRKLSSRLLYPCPPSPTLSSLGTHLTLDLSGNIRFGPDVFWTDNPTDFTFSSFTKQQCDAFIKEINTYLPSVQANELEVDYTGIRPKLGKHWSDFRLDFGLDGTTLQCLGIESPGLTSCLSIGEFVCRELFGKI